MVEKIRILCEKNGTTLAGLEKQLGFANGSLAKSDNKIQSIRLKAIADYFGVSMEYFLSDEDPAEGYYINPQTAAVAQEIFENKDLRALFDAAQNSNPKDLQLAAEMLRRFKETNPDG